MEAQPTTDTAPRCCVIDWENQRAQVLELESQARRLVYGKHIRPRIERADTHQKLELEGHNGPVRGALLLGLGRGSFLTVGEDHVIISRDADGKTARTFGHKKRVRFVWDLADHLVSWSNDQLIRVWAPNDEEPKLRIQSKLDGPGELNFSPARDFLWFRTVHGTRIARFDTGEKILLRGQTEPWDEIARLKDGRWVTRTNEVITLWTRKGKAKQVFPNSGSIQSSLFELRDGRLLVVDGASNIVMLSPRGRRVAIASERSGVAALFTSYSRASQDARRAIEERPSTEHFEHRRNPYAPTHIPREVHAGRSPRGAAPYDQPLWQFFNRPDFQAIHRWQRECIQELEQVQEHGKSVRRELEKKERYLSWGLLGVAALLFSVGLSLAVVSREHKPERMLLALLMASGLAGLLYLYGMIRETSSARTALAPLPQLVATQLAAIEDHRGRILDDLPPVRNQQLYTRQFLRAQIEQAVYALRDFALQECGLSRDELSASSVGLGDWAFLHVGRADAARLCPDTLTSFWWTPDTQELIYAVQRIQYLFMAAAQVDVVTVLYDFVEQRVLEKTAHAFAYRDLIDVSKRSIERDAAALGMPGQLTASELVFTTASGEHEALTVLNETSVSALRSAESSERHAQRVRDVQEQLKAASVEPPSGGRASVTWALHAELRALACELGPASERFDERLDQIRRNMLVYKRRSHVAS